MSISLHIDAASPDELHSHIGQLFPHLRQGTTAPVETGSTRKPRASTKDKQEAGEAEAGNGAGPGATPGTADTTTTESSQTTKETSGSVATTADTATSSDGDLEELRAKLKQLGATKGLGHDKVFELLGKHKAKNASTVPAGKRREVIDAVTSMIAEHEAAE